MYGHPPKKKQPYLGLVVRKGHKKERAQGSCCDSRYDAKDGPKGGVQKASHKFLELENSSLEDS